MPSALAASSCPGSTASRPARTISARYAASFNARPIHAALNAVMIACESMLQNSTDVSGMPSDRRGMSTANRPQNTNCVYTGVPRKNQM